MDASDDLLVTLAGVLAGVRGLLQAHQPCAVCSFISSHIVYLLYLLLPNSYLLLAENE